MLHCSAIVSSHFLETFVKELSSARNSFPFGQRHAQQAKDTMRTIKEHRFSSAQNRANLSL
jgi:hypothetical protein